MLRMAGRRKLDREQILASMNVKCPLCGAQLPPNKQMRIDFERMRCPDCGEVFKAEKGCH
jgi:predicted Zn finger-like uncharacterized protein